MQAMFGNLKCLCRFFVPSSSGLAVLTIADYGAIGWFSGVGRWIGVTAYQSALMGFGGNLFNLTFAVVMAIGIA